MFGIELKAAIAASGNMSRFFRRMHKLIYLMRCDDINAHERIKAVTTASDNQSRSSKNILSHLSHLHVVRFKVRFVVFPHAFENSIDTVMTTASKEPPLDAS